MGKTEIGKMNLLSGKSSKQQQKKLCCIVRITFYRKKNTQCVTALQKIDATLFMPLTFSELNILTREKELFLLHDFTLEIIFSLLFWVSVGF